MPAGPTMRHSLAASHGEIDLRRGALSGTQASIPSGNTTMQKEDMLYNGTTLAWYGHGLFRATSGLPGHQNATEQSLPEAGPIPEGLFSFPLTIAKDATMVGP